MWSISYRKFLMLDIELCFTWDQLYLFKKTEKFQNIMTMIAFQFYYYKCYLDHCVFLYWLFHFQLSSLTEEYCHWLINPLHCFNSKNSPILCLLKFVTKPCSGNWSGVSSHWKDTFEMFLHLAIYNDSYIKKKLTDCNHAKVILRIINGHPVISSIIYDKAMPLLRLLTTTC